MFKNIRRSQKIVMILLLQSPNTKTVPFVNVLNAWEQLLREEIHILGSFWRYRQVEDILQERGIDI
jgi:hypothetical protein